MTSKKKRILKVGAIILIAGLIICGGAIIYMYNMPHRNVQNTSTDYSLTASQLVAEYLENPQKANEKYLSDDGDSKILEISGVVINISKDFNSQTVILLKNESDKAGVRCTFTKETSVNAKNVKLGQTITIKGVIRLGASYDEDMEMYENVIMEKCNIVKQ